MAGLADESGLRARATPRTTARSVIRRGPVRSSVDNVDSEVRLMSLGSRRIASVASPCSACQPRPGIASLARFCVCHIKKYRVTT